MKINKKKLITFSAFVFIFIAGLLTERLHIDNKLGSFLKNFYDDTSRFVYSLFPREKIVISIEDKEYKKILDIREQSIKKSKLTKDLERWSEGELLSENETHKIQIRLKGVFPDHWSDSTQWSFKVKINNNSKPFKDLKRFALQPPKTTSYLYEWLFMKALEKENLFSLGLELIDLNINDKNLGTYMLIGQISDEIIKKNKKKLSPIIGFDSELWVKEQILSNKLYSQGVIKKENGTEDTYYRVKINPIQFSETEKNENDLKKAINLLESFRQGKKNTSETFDTEKLSKIMALRALLGSYQFDWLDTKFYFNSETNLLEPISKEIHVDLDHNYKVYYPTWWIDSYINREDYEKNKDFFVDDLYKDRKFYEDYLKQLNKFSKIKYFEELIKENEKEFNQNLKKLKMNYPSKKVFSKEHLEITRLRIQNYLNPVQNLNAYFKNFDNGVLILNISNLQRLPIKIIGLNFDDGTKMKMDKDYILDGRKPFLPVKIENLEINCKFKSSCKKNRIQNQKLVFKIIGQDKENFASISPYYK